VYFAERCFKLAHVYRLGTDKPARVVRLTWRSTQVRNSDGLLVTIPNRKVTEATIQNLTKAGGTFDSLTVSVTTALDPANVLDVLQRALAECKLAGHHEVAVKELSQKGDTRTIAYQFSWLLQNYDDRNKTREEVFKRISDSIAQEHMVGTEISLA